MEMLPHLLIQTQQLISVKSKIYNYIPPQIHIFTIHDKH